MKKVHYLGFTRNLEQRLESHRHGAACVTTKPAFDWGSGFSLAQTWPGSQKLASIFRVREVA
jgi:hypothetical protein